MARIRNIAVVMLLVAASVGLRAEPASASPDSCAGIGQLQVSGLSPVGLGPPAFAAASLVFTVGGCSFGHGNTANLSLSGHCGLATGGISIDHHSGTAVWAGTTITFTGGVSGSIAVPETLLCGRGALALLFAGWVVLT